MTPRDASKVRSYKPLRSWRWLWHALAVLALVGQFALFAHQADHHRRLDLAGPDDCAMCQFGASMASGPKPEPIILPRDEVIALVIEAGHVAPAAAPRTFAFQSRAPPAVSFA